MRLITWESAKQKTEAYKHLMKVFNASRPTVSQAMNFKSNSIDCGRMRHVALSELGAKYLTDEKIDLKPAKILDAKGNVIDTITM